MANDNRNGFMASCVLPCSEANDGCFQVFEIYGVVCHKYRVFIRAGYGMVCEEKYLGKNMEMQQKVFGGLRTQKTMWDIVEIISDIIQKRSDVVFPTSDMVFAV